MNIKDTEIYTPGKIAKLKSQRISRNNQERVNEIVNRTLEDSLKSQLECKTAKWNTETKLKKKRKWIPPKTIWENIDFLENCSKNLCYRHASNCKTTPLSQEEEELKLKDKTFQKYFFRNDKIKNFLQDMKTKVAQRNFPPQSPTY
ncbi:unnamed protein product [Moneuplotes crassus]|uniref:Uncharacterized protein n=1 Tax=Euplotes crassus TaxID=5936 RepID=A0AAD1UCD0_EUPCR|nr:unnamed protein product [Moneuplotes crassus]